MLSSEVAMTDAEKESEARCKEMLNYLIAVVKKQTLEIEDLAESMKELAVGLKAVVQPPGATAHAWPLPVPAPMATLVTAVDHAVAAAAPRAEAVPAPESPTNTKCSTSGPDTNAGDLQVVAEFDPETGVPTVAPALAEHSSAPSLKLFSTIKQDTLMPTRYSTNCPDRSISAPTSVRATAVPPTSSSTIATLEIGNIFIGNTVDTDHRDTAAGIGTMASTNCLRECPRLVAGDISVTNLIIVGSATCIMGLQPKPPWPPPQGPETVLKLFHKQARVQSWLTMFHNAEMDILNSLAHKVMLEALGPARKMECCRVLFVQGSKWIPGVRLRPVKKIAETIKGRDGGFAELFMTKVDFGAKFDSCLRIKLKGNSKVTALNFCLDDESWRVLEKDVQCLLQQGLTDRTKMIRVLWRSTPSEWNIMDGFSEFGSSSSFTLHFFAGSGRAEPLLMMLHYSAEDLNKLDGSGLTPLMVAAESGHVDIFRLLVMTGDDKKQCTGGNRDTTLVITVGENIQDAGKHSRSGGNGQKSLQQPLWLLILEVVTGVSLLTLLTLCAITGLRRCKARSSGNSVPWTRAIRWKENTVISIDDDLLANVPKISRQELVEACEDFSNIIGSSHDTVVYKGTMKDGREIAVVSLPVSVHYWTNYIELYFQNEVVEMAGLSHENVAKMVGYCKESDPFSRMLVFQYPPNGTLYEHLHDGEDGEGGQLSWPRRMKIALSIARVLRYLHTEMQPPFAVAALTSSSVYLTEDFSPKIIDFERWRALVTKPGLSSGFIVNSGSFNIMNSRHRCFMDVQANTFAFGAILLEVISGRASVSKDTGNLVDWARKHLDQPQEFSKLVDLKLLNVNHENLGMDVLLIPWDPDGNDDDPSLVSAWGQAAFQGGRNVTDRPSLGLCRGP